MRTVVYSRFSTEQQRDTSCDDQIRVARCRADREGWTVVAEYRDEAVSGSVPVDRRPGGARMLADALAGRFDVLLLEGLDRLSRDMVEQERIVRRLEHRNIRIIGVSDGYDSTASGRKIHRGMRGIINEVYLDDLRAKVHRGLSGQFDRGLFAGGMAYGYRTIETPQGRQIEIDPDEAKVVRWIFEQYADGVSPRRIAETLNRKGTPAPRLGSWARSALYGSPAKGTGILNNEMYAGRYLWNRSQWIKDPDTGVRKRMERPKHEWRIAERPELAIVSQELWQAVRDRRDRPNLARGRGKPPATLFGGWLRCAHCGGPVIAVNAFKYGCSAHHHRGTCPGMYIDRQQTETRLLAVLRDELLTPASVSAVLQELRQVQRVPDTAEATAKRMAALERQIANLTEAIAQEGLSKAIRDRLSLAEAERERLKPDTRPKTPPTSTTVLVSRYKRMMADLAGTLKRRPDQARAALRDLTDRIDLELEGEAVYAKFGIKADRVLLAVGGSSTNVVAGDRFVIYRRVRLK